jgi:hypothetical protein
MLRSYIENIEHYCQYRKVILESIALCSVESEKLVVYLQQHSFTPFLPHAPFLPSPTSFSIVGTKPKQAFKLISTTLFLTKCP